MRIVSNLWFRYYQNNPIDSSEWTYESITTVCCAWFACFSGLGAGYSFGVFQEEYRSSVFTESSQARISVIGAILAASTPVVGPLVGYLADKFGYARCIRLGGLFQVCGWLLASTSTELWHLYLTQGALNGFGAALSYFPAASVCSQWFDTRRGVATGVALSGVGIGGFVIGPVTQSLLASEGWRTTCRWLALLTGGVTVLSSLPLHERRPAVAVAPSASTVPAAADRGSVSPFAGRVDSLLALLMFANCVFSFGYFVPFFYLSTFCVERGWGPSFGALAIAAINGASALGRLAFGRVGDRLGHLETLVMCLFAAALAILCWQAVDSRGGALAFAVVFGFSCGGYISLIPAACSRLFGVRYLASYVGLIWFPAALGNLAGPPIAGALLETTLSWAGAVTFAGLSMLSGTLVFGAAILLAKKRARAADGVAQGVGLVN
jgi:MFS family permease